MSKAVIIGSGFSGLACAGLLGSRGVDVTVLEKNDSIGGRARQYEEQGFTFDMGPSWYWMPEIFEQFFSHFGKKPSDYYELIKLDPAFKVFFQDEEIVMPGEPEVVYDLFESIEEGSAQQLRKFMEEAKFKYEVGAKDIIYRQPDGLKPFMNWSTVKSSFRLRMFTSISKHIAAHFKHTYLRQILEFPVLFLGADPKNIPSLYSMMDYSGLMQGTWYPKGGFHEVIKAMGSIAEGNGVEIRTGAEVDSLGMNGNGCARVNSGETSLACDAMIASCDYEHFDQKILPEEFRQYSEKYWDSRVMAPSSLIYYIGYKGKLEGLKHHNLFFDTDFTTHSESIYESKSWPENPQFYVCCPSKTDDGVAPLGHENLFVLIPAAAGLDDSDEMKEHYYEMVMKRMSDRLGVDVKENVVYRRDYAMSDFVSDYHAFKGNAYGLANTLRQTAFLKPDMRHKKLKNVFHCGQLTVPGPGVPPALVSGELAANYVSNYLSK